MIKVENLVKDYGSFHAVKNVSFNIGKGEIVGLLGPNGAGKTTIMKVLTCYHFPTSGRAVLNGADVCENSLLVKKSIGYLPETSPVYTDLTVLEYLDFIADSRDLKGQEKSDKIKEVINECGLTHVVNKDIGNLSKGYRQRVGLAQAIIHEPEILILDEPTTGLDPNQIKEIRALIKKIGERKTVLLSTHILQEVEAVCDRVLIVNDGVIVAEGTTDEIGNTLKGNITIQATFKGSNIENIKENISNINGVINVEELDKSHFVDGKSFNISVDDVNCAEKIFDFAISSNLKLLQLETKKLGLEDIFIRLTEGGNV